MYFHRFSEKTIDFHRYSLIFMDSGAQGLPTDLAGCRPVAACGGIVHPPLTRNPLVAWMLGCLDAWMLGCLDACWVACWLAGLLAGLLAGWLAGD